MPSALCPLRFGILCRFTEQKGIPYILEALRMYRERHGAVDFTFAGQGPLESTIRSAVGSWPLAARTEEKSFEQKHAKSAKEDVVVSAVGGKENPPLRSSRASVQSLPLHDHDRVRIVSVTTPVEILRELDVFVHPGLDDAMPVSIVEALMCGVPCIVSDVGASPELVRDGVEGMVVPPASAGAILAAMERFASMGTDDLDAFKRRARRRYEEACRPQVVGVQVAGIYRATMRVWSTTTSKSGEEVLCA